NVPSGDPSRPDAPNDMVLIEVEDVGTGMPAAILEKIFEPFFTTKGTGEGTGLGLSTVYGIVKQTGGFVFCQSEPGQGTEFEILLPAHDGPIPEAPAAPSAGSRGTALSGLSVLLVEDEAPVRGFAARALAMHGVVVTEAASGEDALGLLADGELHVDIVVSDVVMPGIDGPGWVREAQKTRPDMQIIFVSGYAEESFAEEYPDIPHAAFLPKPFSLRQLIEKVRELAI
ncbi:MAG: response regulator, partial [Pseudomonadota bacterium]